MTGSSLFAVLYVATSRLVPNVKLRLKIRHIKLEMFVGVPPTKFHSVSVCAYRVGRALIYSLALLSTTLTLLRKLVSTL